MTGGKCVVLMSGGIDSSATAVAMLNKGYETSGLFVDYGQPAACTEWHAAREIADRLAIEIEKVELGFRLTVDSGEFFGRNALLVLTAAGTIAQRPLTIALGIHALSEYYDTQPLFLTAHAKDPGRLLGRFRFPDRAVLCLSQDGGDHVCQAKRGAPGNDLQLRDAERASLPAVSVVRGQN